MIDAAAQSPPEDSESESDTAFVYNRAVASPSVTPGVQSQEEDDIVKTSSSSSSVEAHGAHLATWKTRWYGMMNMSAR